MDFIITVVNSDNLGICNYDMKKRHVKQELGSQEAMQRNLYKFGREANSRMKELLKVLSFYFFKDLTYSFNPLKKTSILLFLLQMNLVAFDKR